MDSISNLGKCKTCKYHFHSWNPKDENHNRWHTTMCLIAGIKESAEIQHCNMYVEVPHCSLCLPQTEGLSLEEPIIETRPPEDQFRHLDLGKETDPTPDEQPPVIFNDQWGSQGPDCPIMPFEAVE